MRSKRIKTLLWFLLLCILTVLSLGRSIKLSLEYWGYYFSRPDAIFDSSVPHVGSVIAVIFLDDKQKYEDYLKISDVIERNLSKYLVENSDQYAFPEDRLLRSLSNAGLLPKTWTILSSNEFLYYSNIVHTQIRPLIHKYDNEWPQNFEIVRLVRVSMKDGTERLFFGGSVGGIHRLYLYVEAGLQKNKDREEWQLESSNYFYWSRDGEPKLGILDEPAWWGRFVKYELFAIIFCFLGWKYSRNPKDMPW